MKKDKKGKSAKIKTTKYKARNIVFSQGMFYVVLLILVYGLSHLENYFERIDLKILHIKMTQIVGITKNLISVVLGVLIGNIFANGKKLLQLFNEDKKKISDDNFIYASKYNESIEIDNKKVELCFENCFVAKEEFKFDVEDKKEKNFELDPLIKENYFAIMKAHGSSFIVNKKMIRIDDYHFDESNQKLTIDTSRTFFYNDLVTNRASDYKFSDDFSVRNLFEPGPFLTPLKDSKMSNHIGINALIFYGDKLVLPERGSNSTMSKGQLTSSVAIGLSENDILEMKNDENDQVCREDILYKVVLVRTLLLLHDETLSNDYLKRKQQISNYLKEGEGLYNKDLIKIYFLGFGRLINTCGKPQFYYAVRVNKSCFENLTFKEKEEVANIDSEKKHHFLNRLLLDDTEKIILEEENNKTRKVPIERSFYVNYWYFKNSYCYKEIKDLTGWKD